MLTALTHGLPSLAFPGDHFERGYNSRQLARLGASRHLPIAEFRPSRLRKHVIEILTGTEREEARRLQRRLTTFRGLVQVAEFLEQLAERS